MSRSASVIYVDFHQRELAGEDLTAEWRELNEAQERSEPVLVWVILVPLYCAYALMFIIPIYWLAYTFQGL